VDRPSDPLPKFLSYTISRIRDKCVNRGERGLFSLQRIFKTFDTSGNGLLEFKEFKTAVKDFKLDLSDEDIQSIFNHFDKNNDGVLDMKEFMDMILGDLPSNRYGAVLQAFNKLDMQGRGSVPYSRVRDEFNAKKHPEVCNGRKAEEEALTQFLEIYEVHHNTFNNYKKSD
jgi:Ca2+-binding EF-hand superfamily protein